MKLLIHPAVSAERLAKICAAAAPMTIVQARDEGHAIALIADADALFGYLTPAMLRAAKKLRWAQSPTASQKVAGTTFHMAEAVVKTKPGHPVWPAAAKSQRVQDHDADLVRPELVWHMAEIALRVGSSRSMVSGSAPCFLATRQAGDSPAAAAGSKWSVMLKRLGFVAPIRCARAFRCAWGIGGRSATNLA